MSEERVYPEHVNTETEQKMFDDFRVFALVLWKELRLPPPTKRQLAIIRYLQGGPKRRMIQAFRGIGKTWLTCAYALWRLYRNPNERVKIVSANENKAAENSTFMRRLIDDVPELHFLRPKNGQRDSTLAFDVGPADPHPTPSVSCCGIKGQLTGGRATILISDDVEVPKNSLTELMREQLAELIKEYDALVVPEGFDIIYLGTPQTEASIYKKVRQRGYDCRIWPARYPTGQQVEKYAGALADDILADIDAGAKPGTSTDPQRFSDLDLAEREASYGRSGFALQFMLDTSLSDAERYPLRQSDLIVFACSDMGPVRIEWSSMKQHEVPNIQNVGLDGDRFYNPLYVSPDRAEWEETIMYVDPSGRGKDETAYAVLRCLRGVIYLVASGGFRDGYSDTTLIGLRELARKHRVNRMLVEPNFGDGMFIRLIEPVFCTPGKDAFPITIEEADRATAQKERRIIATMEPVMNQHRLVIHPDVIAADLRTAEEDQRYSLLYQLTHITAEKGSLRHDDRLDALAGGVGYFEERLAINRDQAEADAREQARDAAYAGFMATALGYSTDGGSFQDRPEPGVRAY